ncbi:MAG TPA: hypothetical protein VGU69_04230 [Rhizomicrobium sp.]|nr:hypothetical protein [Rhizomicrobium sp.]
MWLLPGSVSTTVDVITGALAVASIYAGLRMPKHRPPSATADPA